MPAHLGLYASALAPIVAAPFAASRYLQTGPTAMTSLLTLGALSALATAGSVAYVQLAALLALLVGIIRVVLGLLRGGAVANFLSQPVILGFTVAAATLIFASQLPAALGAPRAGDGVLGAAWTALVNPRAWDGRSVAIAAGTLTVVLGAQRVHRLFPGVLAAAVGSLTYSMTVGFDGPTVGQVPAPTLPTLELPLASAPYLLLPAALIALVGFAEPAAIGRTFASMDRRRWDADGAMISQGVANLASGLSGGFPVGASFSRSALARMAGAKTRLTGVVTGVAVLLFLPAARILAPLPKATLAAIVIASIVGLLSRARDPPDVARASGPQALVASGTFALTLALAPHVEYAVLLGVGLSLAVHVWRELTVGVEHAFEAGKLTLRLQGVLWFASAPFVGAQLNGALAAHPEAKELVLQLGGLGRVDYTGALALKSLLEEARAAGLSVRLLDVPPQSVQLVERVCGDAAAP
ncbi:MAG: SulP family inorganic anion transporter [Polyangiaceae bacterium]|nr:SulP family inorganic anion transporter [Polyangiaceae bacterium]